MGYLCSDGNIQRMGCGMQSMQQNPLAKLLIVDDEPAILSSMAQMLNSIGYSVQTAQDGLSALDKIREGIPDI